MAAFARFDQQRRGMADGTLEPQHPGASVSSTLTTLEEHNADVDQLHVGRGGGVHDTKMKLTLSKLRGLPTELLEVGGGPPKSDRDRKYGT